MESNIKYKTECYTSWYIDEINRKLEWYLNRDYEVVSLIHTNKADGYALFVKQKIHLDKNRKSDKITI